MWNRVDGVKCGKKYKILDTIKLMKNTHEIELHKRDSVINKLRTRINVLENDVSIGKIKMEHYEVKVDNNEHRMTSWGKFTKKRPDKWN